MQSVICSGHEPYSSILCAVFQDDGPILVGPPQLLLLINFHKQTCAWDFTPPVGCRLPEGAMAKFCSSILHCSRQGKSVSLALLRRTSLQETAWLA